MKVCSEDQGKALVWAEHENFHTHLNNLPCCWDIWGLTNHPEAGLALLQFAGDNFSFPWGAASTIFTPWSSTPELPARDL